MWNVAKENAQFTDGIRCVVPATNNSRQNVWSVMKVPALKWKKMMWSNAASVRKSFTRNVANPDALEKILNLVSSAPVALVGITSKQALSVKIAGKQKNLRTIHAESMCTKSSTTADFLGPLKSNKQAELVARFCTPLELDLLAFSVYNQFEGHLGFLPH